MLEIIPLASDEDLAEAIRASDLPPHHLRENDIESEYVKNLDWLLEKIGVAIAEKYKIPCPVSIRMNGMMSGGSEYSPIHDRVTVLIEPESVKRIVGDVLNNNPELLKYLAEMYLLSIRADDVQSQNNYQKNAPFRSKIFKNHPFRKYFRAAEKELQSIIGGKAIIDQAVVSDRLINFGIGLLISYRDLDKLLKKIGEDRGKLVKILANFRSGVGQKVTLDQILTLAPELDDEARHEAYHARWSHELHRKHLTPEELTGVEEFLSKADSGSIWRETVARNLGDAAANNLANRKFNQRLWEQVPDEFKQAYVYRAYTAGIEEVLIPLMEIQAEHPRNYQQDFARIPNIYGDQPGLLLISESLFSRIAGLVKSNSDLTGVIEELRQMLTLEAYEHFIIEFYEEMVAEKEKIIQEMQETF